MIWYVNATYIPVFFLNSDTWDIFKIADCLLVTAAFLLALPSYVDCEY